MRNPQFSRVDEFQTDAPDGHKNLGCFHSDQYFSIGGANKSELVAWLEDPHF